MKRDTIEVGIDRVTHHLNLIEGDTNHFVIGKHTSQIGQVLLFGLLLILNLVWQANAIIGFTLDDLTCNDESIITKDRFKEVGILLVICGTKLFYVVEYELTTTQIRQFEIALNDIHKEVHADGYV